MGKFEKDSLDALQRAVTTGEPHRVRPVVCDAAAYLPDVIFPQAQPNVMLAERTFWEKAIAPRRQGGLSDTPSSTLGRTAGSRRVRLGVSACTGEGQPPGCATFAIDAIAVQTDTLRSEAISW